LTTTAAKPSHPRTPTLVSNSTGRDDMAARAKMVGLAPLPL
jgi:hypothetical protein